jgi:NAD(P)-dependent dehydrogenase (short-subunit alcohol dehydrogenase family)
MPNEFQDKVVIVTGAGLGLGRASSVAFARKGANVIVNDIHEGNGRHTVKMIELEGGEATFVNADVTKAAEVESMIAKAINTYGRIDYAHNNAGVLEGGSVIESTEDQWDRVFNLNLKGVWLCMKYELIEMVSQGGGAIVNTSSVAGLIAAPGTSFYAASKWGLNGLTKSAAVEFADKNIRINAVCPAGMKGTGMYKKTFEEDPEFSAKLTSEVPMKRDSYPEEIAETVVWLCSDSASYITGLTMPVDGGRASI